MALASPSFGSCDRPLGDITVLWFRPEALPPGEHFMMVKRLPMPLPPSFELPLGRAIWGVATVGVEMLNRERRWAILASELLAIRSVVGITEQRPD